MIVDTVNHWMPPDMLGKAIHLAYDLKVTKLVYMLGFNGDWVGAGYTGDGITGDTVYLFEFDNNEPSYSIVTIFGLTFTTDEIALLSTLLKKFD